MGLILMRVVGFGFQVGTTCPLCKGCILFELVGDVLSIIVVKY
jgi:hypothetical protein